MHVQEEASDAGSRLIPSPVQKSERENVSSREIAVPCRNAHVGSKVPSDGVLAASSHLIKLISF